MGSSQDLMDVDYYFDLMDVQSSTPTAPSRPQQRCHLPGNTTRESTPPRTYAGQEPRPTARGQPEVNLQSSLEVTSRGSGNRGSRISSTPTAPSRPQQRCHLPGNTTRESTPPRTYAGQESRPTVRGQPEVNLPGDSIPRVTIKSKSHDHSQTNNGIYQWPPGTISRANNNDPEPRSSNNNPQRPRR